MDDFQTMQQRMKEEEEERLRSIERARVRAKNQTEVVKVSLVRHGKMGFGLGIADTDGHCLVHRLVRNEYYNDGAPDDENPVAPPRLRLNDRIIKVGDKLVVDYASAVEAIKATPDILDLTVVRDPNEVEPIAWLRDRIYNHSKPLYYSILTLLCAVILVIVGWVIWLIWNLPPHTPQSPRHDYHYPFGNHPKDEDEGEDAMLDFHPGLHPMYGHHLGHHYHGARRHHRRSVVS